MMACGPILKTSLSSSKFEKCTNTSNNMSTPHIYTYWLIYINIHIELLSVLFVNIWYGLESIMTAKYDIIL